MRAARAALLALGCSWLAVVGAQEVEPERPEPVPDLDFLEYLGAWVEEDDEWLVEEWRKDNTVEAEKDAEKSESETDDDDESE
jgi:hypothetical protein